MTIKKIKYYIILLIVFFSWVSSANASLEITEIMYMPENGSSYEWVEIYNNGSTPIDLNKYRFFHGETSGPITLKSGTTTVLQPSKYAIIAKSLTSGYSWLDFSGSIFSAGTLSLPDSSSGEYNTYIAISDVDENIINDVTYDTSKGGSKISKSSLSKIDGEWQSGIPTPGVDNQELDNSSGDEDTTNSTNNNTDNTSTSTGSSILGSSSTKEDPVVLKITTKIISPKIVVAGIPFSLSSLTTTNRGETYAVGKFVWNFGDGMVREIGKSSPFDYVYEYPGEYALTLSYFNSYFSKGADATDRIIVKVIPSEIFISSVGSEIDPFIELENKSNYEIILSNWVVTAGMHYFVIPEGTTLLPSKKMKLSPKITGFVSEDIKSVIITNPSKEIVATYPTEIKKPTQKNTSVYAIAQNNVSSANKNSQDDPLSKNSQVINLNDLGASTGESGVNIPNSAYPLIGLFVIIGLGITSFLLIKRRKNDNAYVEKEIRAEDMTIIE